MSDLDLEIREARSFRPPGGWGAVSKKIFFRPFKPHFGLKIKGRGGGGEAGPLGPFPGSATGGDAPLRNGVTAGDVNKF